MVPQPSGPKSHEPLMKREKCMRAASVPGMRRSYLKADIPTGGDHAMPRLTRRTAAVAAAAALAALPATALAATIQGGPGGERLRGTNAADVIDGNAGNDRIAGRAGPDRLTGGLGDD